jgi:REP element-mobilizing transposase RayT
VERAWQEAPLLWPTVDLKALVVMSNHLHALVRLRAPAEGAMNRAPTLGQVVRGLKARSSRQARGGALPGFAWQRGYHDRILRRTEEIQVAYDYVRTNPARWAEDADNLLAHHGAGAWDVPGRRGGL